MRRKHSRTSRNCYRPNLGFQMRVSEKAVVALVRAIASLALALIFIHGQDATSQMGGQAPALPNKENLSR